MVHSKKKGIPISLGNVRSEEMGNVFWNDILAFQNLEIIVVESAG